MNKFLVFVLWSIIGIYSSISYSGGGGISGGTNAEYEWVKIYSGEGDQQFNWVRIKNRFTEEDRLRALNHKPECFVHIGEATLEPCKPDHFYQIPKFLQNSNSNHGSGDGPN